MKVVFLGTPEFAVKSLEAIIKSGHTLSAVVCQPDKPGNRNKFEECEVKKYALSMGLNVLQYNSVSKEGLNEIRELNADIAVTSAFGQLLSEDFIHTFKEGVLNVHGSLLPEYRGASPIQSALINGESRTGVSIVKTVYKLDAGDLLLSRAIAIDSDETYGSLCHKLSDLGAELIVEALKKVESGTARFTPQDESKATYCKKITKNVEIIDWKQSAYEVHNLIRGLCPIPAASTLLDGKVLKITASRINENESVNADYGRVIQCDKRGITVLCAKGSLGILEVKPQGGKQMSYKDAVNGRKLREGDILGS
ncbi:MAG: methionyl-tRNA formyltransferase [Clostridia bacterium]|nr:methionyl-tRNA formyltransferase [Clostridia bacterium]